MKKNLIQNVLDLGQIQELPDSMNPKELETVFNQAIELFEKSKPITNLEFIKILDELTCRQSDTYELLRNDLRNKVDELLCEIWDLRSYEIVDITLSIVVNLGLTKCYYMIREELNNGVTMSKDVKKEIIATIEEVGDNILNPYHSLERFK